jgi:hypothetical protein
MLKTIETPVTELKAGDLIFDIQPESAMMYPMLFKVLKINNSTLVTEGMGDGGNKGYYFSYIDDKKCATFSISSKTTWYKLVY